MPNKNNTKLENRIKYKDTPFYTYTLEGEKLWGYKREYCNKQLKRRGFQTKSEAEAGLREQMNLIDNPPAAPAAKPTTLQDAFDSYKAELESQVKLKAAGESGTAYKHGVTSVLNVLQTFVVRIGPTSEVRDIKEIDLREWYLWLQDETREGGSISQASSSSHLGRLGGMLKHAQENRPDLATWNRPKVKNTKAKIINGGRVVTDQEYKALIEALAAPPSCKRIAGRRALWREASDAARLLRNTGGRLNEILRIKLDQIDLSEGTITLYATKTEEKRTNPLSNSAATLIRARMREGLSDETYLFARATKSHFDGDIESACRDAAKQTKLKYGRKTAGGFTLHGLRHTYITDLLARGVDIPTVMQLSGHKSLQSFSVYLHATDFGRRKAKQLINDIDSCLELTGELTGQAVETGVTGGNEYPLGIAVNE